MIAENSIWWSTKKMLIVLPFHSEEHLNLYRKSLDALLAHSNVQHLQIIVFIPDTLKDKQLLVHPLIQYVTPKELSFFQMIKKENRVKKILREPYDMLLWFELNQPELAKLCKNMICPWKIGINTSMEFFNISANCNSNTPNEIINFAKYTLDKLKNNA